MSFNLYIGKEIGDIFVTLTQKDFQINNSIVKTTFQSIKDNRDVVKYTLTYSQLYDMFIKKLCFGSNDPSQCMGKQINYFDVKDTPSTIIALNFLMKDNKKVAHFGDDHKLNKIDYSTISAIQTIDVLFKKTGAVIEGFHGNSGCSSNGKWLLILLMLIVVGIFAYHYYKSHGNSFSSKSSSSDTEYFSSSPSVRSIESPKISSVESPKI